MLDTPTLLWTPKLVDDILIEAFETLRAIGVRPGPKSFGSNWPAIVQEAADSAPEEDKRRAPTVKEITRMEEALQWPSRYLADEPKMADALNVWAFCKAMRMSLDKFAKIRAERVTTIARRVQEEHDAERKRLIRIAHDDADAWAAERFLEARGDLDRIAKIRANAELRKERAVKAIRIQLVDPTNIMPDKAISASEMTRQRYQGSGFIALGLNHDGVPGAREAAQRAAEKAEAALQLSM